METDKVSPSKRNSIFNSPFCVHRVLNLIGKVKKELRCVLLTNNDNIVVLF